MFDKFTDRSKKVMVLAQQEAQRFNHEYVGTEHILLGLAKEGSGVAAAALKYVNVDLRRIRLEIEKLTKCEPKIVVTGKLPNTPRTENVLKFAVEEAKSLGHNYIGTEHLLLGLIREVDGVACQVLMNFHLSVDTVRDAVMHYLEALDEPDNSNEPDNSPEKFRYKYDVYESYFLHDKALLDYLNVRGRSGSEVVYMDISDTFGHRYEGVKLFARIIFKKRF